MRYIVSLLGIIGMIPLYMLKKALETNVLRHEISTENFIDHSPFRLFFISDIHRRKITKKLLKEVGSTIDIVIIGGDLAEANVPRKRIEDNLRKLAQLAPIYYVWGNNDREVGESTIRELIEGEYGVILENEAICVRQYNHRIMIVGIDDLSSGRAKIQSAFESTNTGDTIIFVSHTPSVFEKVRIEYDPDILLAGHTHGGQIRLGPYGLYPLGKLQEKDKKVSLISNGYGTSLLPLRLGAESECHIVTIQRSRYTNL